MIYIIIPTIFFLMFLYEYNNQDSLKIRSNVFWLSSVILFLFFALRGSNVGGDTLQYCLYYNSEYSSTYGHIDDPESTIEIGFIAFCKVLSNVIPGDFGLVFFSSLFTLIPFIILCKKYAPYPVLSYFYIFFANNLQTVINIETNLRQDISVGLIICAIYLALEGFKNVKRVIAILLLLTAAILTHTSTYLIVPALIILWFVPFNKWVGIGIIVVSMILSMFFINSIEGMASSIFLSDFFMGNEAFDKMTKYFDSSSRYLMTGESAKFFALASVSIWVIFNLWMSEKDECNNIFMKSLFMGCAAYNIGASFPLAFRMVFLFQFLGLVYVPRRIRESSFLMTINFLMLSLSIFNVFKTIFDPMTLYADNHLLPYEFIWD